MNLNTTPNYTTTVTGHGNINAYLYKYKITDNPACLCRKGPQTVQHIVFDCPLIETEREKLKAVVTRSGSWPVSCNKLGTKYHKHFKEHIDKISWNTEQNTDSQ